MPVDKFSIGIENEGFWRGKADYDLPANYKDPKTFAHLIARLYKNVHEDHQDLHPDFTKESHPGHGNPEKWLVCTDDAIGSSDNLLGGEGKDEKWPEGYRLEFVTRVLTFGRNSNWREEIKKHWAALLQILEVEVDDGCATHVHISPEEKGLWSLEQLKQLSKAIIYFAKAFRTIWAPSRRNHSLTQSNKGQNYKLKDIGFAECCKLIDGCATKQDIIDLMQPGETKADGQSRDYAWNFEPTERKIGTIEFRCAPGVTKVEHCLIWVELAVSFVQATMESDTVQVLEQKVYKDDAEGLKEFILRAGVDGMNKKDYLDIVFQKQNGGAGWKNDDGMRAAFDKSL